MSPCVYCGKDTCEKNFNREHIIPQFFGTFNPVNPTIQKTDKLVCKKCNSVTFSALENIYKEDSEDGLFAQRLNLSNKDSIRIRGERLKIESVSGFGDSFFDQIFPFLKLQNNQIIVDLKPQIKVRGYRGGYQIFLIKSLKKINDAQGKKFNKVKERLSKVENINLSIFTFGDKNNKQDLLDAIELLKAFGVSYKEKKSYFAPELSLYSRQWKEQLQAKIDTDIARVIVKIAFNYFAYCAIQDNQTQILFLEEFQRVREFIAGKSKLGAKDVIISIDKNTILGEEDVNKRYVVHLLTFEYREKQIIARLSFFGRRVYEILIGEMPDEYKSTNFGCGHAFNPFSRTIIPLSQNRTDDLSKEKLQKTFGLFKRTNLNSSIFSKTQKNNCSKD